MLRGVVRFIDSDYSAKIPIDASLTMMLSNSAPKLVITLKRSVMVICM